MSIECSTNISCPRGPVDSDAREDGRRGLPPRLHGPWSVVLAVLLYVVAFGFAFAIERLRIEWTWADDEISWQVVMILGVSIALAVVGFMPLTRRESFGLGSISVALLAVPYLLDAIGATWRMAYLGEWLILLLNVVAVLVGAVLALFAVYFFLALFGIVGAPRRSLTPQAVVRKRHSKARR